MARSILWMRVSFLFPFLLPKELGILEHSNPLDLYALHFVFLPDIQSQLDVFRDGWSFHPLRTEWNRKDTYVIVDIWSRSLTRHRAHSS